MRNLKHLKRIGVFAALAGLILLVLTACSTGVGPVIAGGNLQITVSGLPQGVDANVLVDGPDGYHQRATKSVTLTKLTSGSYIVTPLGVSSGTMGYQTGKAQTVNISAASGAAVKVTYSELPTKLQPNAVKLNAATSQSLSSVTHDTSGNSTLTFSQSTLQLQKLKVADVITVGITPATPKGFMGKVTGISGLTVTTGPAKLTDILQQGVLAFHQTFSSSDVASVQVVQPGATFRLVPPPTKRLSPQAGLGSICASLSASLSASGAHTGAAVTTSGSVCLSPGIDGSIIFNRGQIVGAQISTWGNISASLSISGELNASVEAKVLVGFIPFDPIPLGEGLFLTPTINFYVGGQGTISVGVSTGVSDNLNYHAGIRCYELACGSWAGASNVPAYTWPQPAAGASLKVYAGPELNLEIDGIAGAVVGLDGYLQFDVDFLHDPLWKLHGGLEVNVGLSGALGFLSYTYPVYTKDWVLATSNSTPPESATVWSYATGDVIAAPALSNDGKTLYVGGVDGTLYALRTPQDITGASRLKWTYPAGAAIYAAPSVASNGTIYLSTNDGLFAVNPDGSLKWQALEGILVDASASIGSDGTVYAAAQDGNLYALNPGDGSVKWHYTTGGSIIKSSPAIGTDGTIYVGSSDGHLYALNPGGSLKWNRTLGIYVNTSPALDGGTAYALVAEDGAYQLLFAINASSGKVLWQATVNQNDLDTSPTIGADGTIYVGSVATDDRLYAIDPTTHQVKWSYKTSGLIKGAPTVGADGDIYVTATGTSTTLYAVKAGGSLDWKVPLEGQEAFGVALDSGGTLYVSTGGNTGQTQAVHTSSKGLAASPWPKLHHDNQNTGRAQ